MATQGPNSVTAGATIAGTGAAWNTPEAVTLSNNTWANVTTGTQSELLAATGPGFTDPGPTDTVNGFTVEIEASRSAGTLGTLDEVFFTKDGTTAVGSNLLGAPQTVTATDTYYTVGGPTALGGVAWTVAEAEAATMGVLIRGSRDAATLRVDHVRITIHYTATATTRFYLPSTGAAAVSPAFAAGWEGTTGADRLRMVTTRIASAMTDKVMSTLITAGDALTRQYVSSPLSGAQTVNANVKLYARASETLDTVDAVSRIILTVVSNDGSTLRGTLLALADYSTGAEWNTTNRNKAFADGDTPTSVAALDGDRIVLEIGFGHAAVVSSATINFGDNSATDLAENETGTAADNPWLEIGQTLVFVGGQPTMRRWEGIPAMWNLTHRRSKQWVP